MPRGQVACVWCHAEGEEMSKRTMYVVGGAGAGVLALLLLPGWLTWLVIIAVVAVPVAGYFMLDPSQRRRLRRVSRKQIGR